MSPRPNSSSSPTATEVVLHYESLRERGEDITPEVACEQMGCPHLLEEVKKQILDLDSIRQFLKSTTTDDPGAANEAGDKSFVPPVPPRLDHYQILHTVGKGGFGVVWRAYDSELDRHVAIKVPRPDRHFSEEEISLFVREARKAASLDHPNIVKLYHARRSGGAFFLISEFIEGKSLNDLLRKRKFSFEESSQLVVQVAEALHHAHLRGFVHRDVKPSNILLNQEFKPYLADFGLAVTEEEQLEEPNSILGTVAYMSPEQAQGGNRLVDARSDIYSLGMVFYELLTGRLPFKAKNTVEFLDQIIQREPRPPRTINDAIPPELERICLKCLAKSVTDRYTTALDLANDLRAFLRQEMPTTSIPLGALPQKPISPLVSRRILLLSVVAIGILGLGLLFIWRPWENSNPIVDPVPNKGKTTTVMVEPQPGAWQDLLEKEPEILIHPKVFNWKFDTNKFTNKKELWLDPSGNCMCRLGTSKSDDYEIELTLEQSHLAGHRGLFLGLPSELSDDTKLNQCVVFLIVPDALIKGNFLLLQGTLTIDAQTRKTKQLKQLGPYMPLTQFTEKKFTIAARVTDGQLEWIKVGESQFTGPLPNLDSEQKVSFKGDFGIFADFDSLRLTHARWKIHKKEN